MKKVITAFLLALMLFAVVSCSSPSGDDTPEQSSEIHITDDIYCETINHIHINYEEYLGQTVRLEGVYSIYHDESNGNTYNYVFRSGPGCCAYDGAVCGFEFVYDDALPEEGDWIEVTGVLDAHEEEYEGELLLYLNIRAQSVVSYGQAQEGAVNIDHPQKEESEHT